MIKPGKGHERRSQLRSRCLKGARIILANGNSTLACRVKNQSEAGIRLDADETSVVPTTFTLVRDGATTGHLCKVVWRSRDELGACIIDSTELAKEDFSRSSAYCRPREVNIVNRYPV